MTRLRIYSETLPYARVTEAGTVALLARHGLELVLAVQPWQLDELPRVARVLRDAGVGLAVWPMLSNEDGRWASERNAGAFVQLVERTVDVLEAAGTPPREVLFDLEPSFGETELLRPGRALAVLGVGTARALPRASRSGTFAEAERILARATAALHTRGVATSAAVWPLVALGPPGDRSWQSLLGTPVDALGAQRVSVLAYTSIFEGWSRGTLRRADAAALLAAAGRRVVRRYGSRASLSLGCVGTGAYENEPVYRGPEELAEDVAIARAVGCEDLSLFDLAGVLARPPAERWLEAFVTPRPPPRLPRSRRISAARPIARAATWLLRIVAPTP